MSIEGTLSSNSGGDPSGDAAAALDRLAGLLDRFPVRAALFHSGPLCGLHVFDAQPGRAFLHVLRRGQMEMRHREARGLVRTCVNEPTMLLFARPVHHEFVNPPVTGSDFTCATLDFDGGSRHPIVQALPPVLRVPLASVEGLGTTLDLLFAESEQVRCGSTWVANRLFEVLLIRVLRWILDHPVESGIAPGAIMGLSDPRLAKALVALHGSPHAGWPLGKLASVAGMSRSAFAAAFKQAVGKTPAAYVLDWRLGIAGSMLRDGRPIKQIALELGFADASALSKAFRRRAGVSPRSWRSQAEYVQG